MRKTLSGFAIVLTFSIGMVEDAKGSWVVGEGFDLFQTVSAGFDFGIPFGEQNFVGNPFETFDFGSGTSSTGVVDTIVKRKESADSGGGTGTDTIEIELVALSLVSVNTFNLGSGSERLLATGVDTGGSQMDITFDNMFGGTFDSLLNLHVTFTGEYSGLVFDAFGLQLISENNTWGRTPPTGGVIIDGINHRLNGSNTDDDFWLRGYASHDASGAAKHVVTSPVPEPTTSALFGLGIVCLIGYRVRNRKAA